MTTKRAGFAGIAMIAAAAAHPAVARDRRISPYVEAAQVLTWDSRTDDTVTYTELSAGVDANVQTRRVQVTAGYRYTHQFGYSRRIADNDVHTGLARGSVALAPGFTIDGGAVATRARTDIRGGAAIPTLANQTNTQQIFSGDIGPSLNQRVGPVGMSASYRYGYTHAGNRTNVGLPAGQRPLDVYDHSQRHLVQASAGVRAGLVLPVGLSVGGAYETEDAAQLDQRYRGAYGRGDAVLPVAPTVALTAGVGYEKIRISQRDPVVNAAGVAQVNPANGRFITDRSTPRRLAYETEGVFWDAGVLYRPSPRTTIQARAGRRYDSWTYTGSLSYQASSAVGVNVGVYDSIQSFGRQLRGGIASLPTTFNTTNDPFGQSYTGCVFGTANSESAGGCLNSAFQSASTANYRARGVDGVIVANRGPTSFGFGAGYANHEFLVPNGAPGLVITNGAVDQSAYAQFFASHALDRDSGIAGNIAANYFNSGVAGAPDLYGASASGSYYRRFGRLGASLSAGVFGYDSAQSEADIQASGRVAVRYGF